MIYTVSTKNGIGIELWGTNDDLQNFYDIVNKFWNIDEYETVRGFENRNNLISSFTYEIRHSFQGSRLKRENSHYSSEPCTYFGTKFSWVHILFSLSALRQNMNLIETNKLDISIFLGLEYWLENSMESFDSSTTKKLRHFINGGIYGGNEYIYQFMRSINAEYISLGGGKKNFKMLPEILERAILFSADYKTHLAFLESEAKRHNCEISNLEFSDEGVDYDSLEW